MVFDGARADEQLSRDLAIRVPLRRQARDLRLLRRQLVARVDRPLAGMLAGRATQTGNLVGIPATGRRIQWDAVDIYRVRDDGKISEQWAFEDMAAILSQTGAAKLPWAG